MYHYEFSVWFNGYRSVLAAKALDSNQVLVIRNHLNLVKAVCGTLDPINEKVFKLISRYRQSPKNTFPTRALYARVPEISVLRNETELAFWVQGAIEIGQMKNLTTQQITVIRERIRNMESPCALGNYILKQLDLFVQTPERGEQRFAELRTYLDNLFQHAIEPTYAGDQEHFGLVHAGRAT